MKWRGGGEGEGVKRVIKWQKDKKIDDINLTPYFLVCDAAFILSS